jgi:peroxiredoxin
MKTIPSASALLLRSATFLCLFAAASVCFGVEAVPSRLGQVPPFTLPTTDGQSVSLPSDDADLTVLCFLGTECPLAKLYAPRLQTMAQTFGDRVRFIGINSNVQDSMDELSAYASEHGVEFAMAKDDDRQVAVSAGATRTPEVIVVDRVGAIRYRGRIDNQYEPGVARADATEHHLRDALQSLVDGQPVARPVTEPVGCLIALPKRSAMSTQSPTVAPEGSSTPAVTYCDQVVRVLQKHCIECHRAGEIGPFALDDYDEVVGWADMSVEVIDNGRMPPWHATDGHAEFSNARLMPESDKQILRDWVLAGTPYGDADDLPPSLDFVAGWQLPRQPDLVLPMRDKPFRVPATGIVEYQYYVAKMEFPTDRWVKAAEVIPGNRGVVHHAIAFIRPPDGSDFRKQGLLSAYVPGQRQSALPDGYAQRIPAGSRIVFQMHYTPTGKPETDITKIGLVFVDESEVTHEVFGNRPVN